MQECTGSRYWCLDFFFLLPFLLCPEESRTLPLHAHTYCSCQHRLQGIRPSNHGLCLGFVPLVAVIKCFDKRTLKTNKFILARSSGCSPLRWVSQGRRLLKHLVALYHQKGAMNEDCSSVSFLRLYSLGSQSRTPTSHSEWVFTAEQCTGE